MPDHCPVRQVWLTTLCLVWMAATACWADATTMLNFVAIPDAHMYTGHHGFVAATVEQINALSLQPDFVISLGDNIAGGQDHQVLQDARDYAAYVARLKAPHHYVIGNHECIPVEVYKLLTWEQLLGAWGMTSRWHSFDLKGFHICVLESWSALQGKPLLAEELAWLREDLQATDRPTIVFAHEALGFQQADCADWIATNNRKFWPPGNEFEQIFEAHRDKLIGVFSGHKHKCVHKVLNGVTYHTLGANFINGQFVQVFADTARNWLVLGHPDRAETDPKCELQQTYGDRALLERAQR
ncbi:MAG: metallophosphoesterase [Armatimonadetes bacterium]|nr:metallophosphoesterase [Armatimonadota bacterium]